MESKEERICLPFGIFGYIFILRHEELINILGFGFFGVEVKDKWKMRL